LTVTDGKIDISVGAIVSVGIDVGVLRGLVGLIAGVLIVGVNDGIGVAEATTGALVGIFGVEVTSTV
jgi:hypothetical protein